MTWFSSSAAARSCDYPAGPGRSRGRVQARRETLDTVAEFGHRLPLPQLRPRHISDVQDDGDLVVTVCDLAREELGHQAAVHWSVPDPVPAGDPVSFDAAVAELSHRVERLAPRLDPAS